MRKYLTIAAAMMFIASTPAFANEEAPATTAEAAPLNLKVGEFVAGADGKRIGRIYQVSKEGNAEIINGIRMLVVPAATMSRVDGKVVSTLSRRDLNK